MLKAGPNSTQPLIAAWLRCPRSQFGSSQTLYLRIHGPAWRAPNASHVSLAQLMSPIETRRMAALGGHIASCEDCGHRRIAYNSRRNRYYPRCRGRWRPSDATVGDAPGAAAGTDWRAREPAAGIWHATRPTVRHCEIPPLGTITWMASRSRQFPSTLPPISLPNNLRSGRLQLWSDVVTTASKARRCLWPTGRQSVPQI